MIIFSFLSYLPVVCDFQDALAAEVGHLPQGGTWFSNLGFSATLNSR